MLHPWVHALGWCLSTISACGGLRSGRLLLPLDLFLGPREARGREAGSQGTDRGTGTLFEAISVLTCQRGSVCPALGHMGQEEPTLGSRAALDPSLSHTPPV